MGITTRGPQKPPIFLAYGLLWLSGFLIMACFYSLPIVAVLRPPHPGLPPRAGDWRLPVLGAALLTSMAICQEWYTRKNGKPRFKPKKLADPAVETKRKLTVGLLITVPVLLLDCFCALMPSHAQVNWPLLLLLNMGEAAGWGGLWWAQRLLPDSPGPDVDPLAPAAAPVVVQVPLPAPVREISYARRERTGLPPAVAFTLIFLGTAAMLEALIAAALGRFWYPLGSLFGPVFLVLALLMTTVDWMSRKRAAERNKAMPPKKLTENVAGLFACFFFIQVVLRVEAWKVNQNWVQLVALDGVAVAALLFVRWLATLPVAFPVKPAAMAGAGADWLPNSSVARRTPTEIVFQSPLGVRLFVGGFSVVMTGMTVMSAVLTFAPALVDPHPRHPFPLEMRAISFACTVGLAFFTAVILGGAGPRDLRLELDSRTYTQVFWKRWPGMLGQDGTGVPFRVRRASGLMDADMAGVGVREFSYKGTTRYILQLVWNDTGRPPHVLRSFEEAEEARAAMLAASAALGLPALGRVE